MGEQPDLLSLVSTEDIIPQNSHRMELSNSQQAYCSLLSEGWSCKGITSSLDQHSGNCSSPALCSMIGAVAKGTDFKSKGFSEGSRVYWCRALSRPGMDTVKPGGRRDRSLKPQIMPALCHLLNRKEVQTCFEDFLLYHSGCSQHWELSASAPEHSGRRWLCLSLHCHHPSHTWEEVENFLQCKAAESTQMNPGD